VEPANAMLLELGIDRLDRLATKGEHALAHFLHIRVAMARLRIVTLMGSSGERACSPPAG